MIGNTRVREAIMAITVAGKTPDTMAEVRDALNARAFDRQARKDYESVRRPSWKIPDHEFFTATCI